MTVVRLRFPEDWHEAQCDNPEGYDPVEMIHEQHYIDGDRLPNEVYVELPVEPQIGDRIFFDDETFEVVQRLFFIRCAANCDPESTWGTFEDHLEVKLKLLGRDAS